MHKLAIHPMVTLKLIRPPVAQRRLDRLGRVSPSGKPQLLKVEGGELKIGSALKEKPPGCDPPLKTEAGADSGRAEAGTDPERAELTGEPAAGGPDGDGDGPSVCPPPHREIVSCDCDVKNEVDVGPVYCRLGSAATLEELRRQLAEQTDFTTEQVRLETVRYTGHEGKTEQGCPIAKWVLRRRDDSEQLLAVAKRRPGHRCRFTFLVLMLVVWDALAPRRADTLYSSLVERLNRSATPTRRGCGANRPRTCMCQGLDSRSEGASFSFGCSYSMYFNACKFARSHQARKFRLNHPDQEAPLEQELQELATEMAPLYRRVAPVAYQNQVRSEQAALECRLGLAPGRPWSGVTACLDFCAHAHRDIHNTRDGCTAVLTLLKPRAGEVETPPGQAGPGASVGQPTAVQSGAQLDRTDAADGEESHQNTAPAVGERDDGLNGWSSDAQLSSTGELTPNGLLEPNGQLNFSNGHRSPPNGPPGLSNGLQSPGVQPGPSDGQLNVSGDTDQPALYPDPPDSQPARPTADPAEEVVSPSEPPDEQLHVLPLYVLEESGEEQRDGVQRLHSYPVEIRRREVPLATCTVRRAAKRPLPSRPGSAAAAPGSALGGRVSAAGRRVHWPGLQEALGSCGRAVVGWLGGEPGALSEPGAESALSYPSDPVLYPGTPALPRPSDARQPLGPAAGSAQTSPGDGRDAPGAPAIGPARQRWQSVLPGQATPRVPLDPTVVSDVPHSRPGTGAGGDRSEAGGDRSGADWERTEDGVRVRRYQSDCSASFSDRRAGGVAVALTHGSLLLECAVDELHATTALRRPDRRRPSRLSLVFYQHKGLQRRRHGWIMGYVAAMAPHRPNQELFIV
ncbi:DNA N6-methyl adenine demethylase-like [Amphibalanus amphitrite]|uniref:DNA N6-methyl adenine demethylase-like n=1 Tax=Amphibalanus amphitrite TaxID=1232801 RepID=UPI001C91C82E|nr:DNA N6-methyl adenine demethylase-like [Amphibalanus amphitrite]